MSNVLERIVAKKHYSFINGKDVSWQEAVRLSALPLVEDGSVDSDYYKQIVACIEKHGPYIVMEHNIAMRIFFLLFQLSIRMSIWKI